MFRLKTLPLTEHCDDGGIYNYELMLRCLLSINITRKLLNSNRSIPLGHFDVREVARKPLELPWIM